MPRKVNLKKIPKINKAAEKKNLAAVLEHKTQSLAAKDDEDRSILGYWINGFSTAFSAEHLLECNKEDIRELIWNGASFTKKERDQLDRLLREKKELRSDTLTILRIYQLTNDHKNKKTLHEVAEETRISFDTAQKSSLRISKETFYTLRKSVDDVIEQLKSKYVSANDLKQAIQLPAEIISPASKASIIEKLVEKSAKDTNSHDTNKLVIELACLEGWSSILPKTLIKNKISRPVKEGETTYSDWLSYAMFNIETKTNAGQSLFRSIISHIAKSNPKLLNGKISKETQSKPEKKSSTAKNRLSKKIGIPQQNHQDKKTHTKQYVHPIEYMMKNNALNKLTLYLSNLNENKIGIDMMELKIQFDENKKGDRIGLQNLIHKEMSGDYAYYFSKITISWLYGEINKEEKDLLIQLKTFPKKRTSSNENTPHTKSNNRGKPTRLIIHDEDASSDIATNNRSGPRKSATPSGKSEIFRFRTHQSRAVYFSFNAHLSSSRKIEFADNSTSTQVTHYSCSEPTRIDGIAFQQSETSVTTTVKSQPMGGAAMPIAEKQYRISDAHLKPISTPPITKKRKESDNSQPSQLRSAKKAKTTAIDIKHLTQDANRETTATKEQPSTTYTSSNINSHHFNNMTSLFIINDSFKMNTKKKGDGNASKNGVLILTRGAHAYPESINENNPFKTPHYAGHNRNERDNFLRTIPRHILSKSSEHDFPNSKTKKRISIVRSKFAEIPTTPISRKGKTMPNTALYIQQTYTNNSGLASKLLDEKSFRNRYLGNTPITKLPFVSTSGSISHAIRYGYGFRYGNGYYEGRQLQPLYDHNGKPSNMAVGKVFIMAYSKKSLKKQQSHYVPRLHANCQINVKYRILGEDETTLIGGIEQKNILALRVLTYPDFSQPYNNSRANYGLTEEQFEEFKNILTNPNRSEPDTQMALERLKKILIKGVEEDIDRFINDRLDQSPRLFQRIDSDGFTNEQPPIQLAHLLHALKTDQLYIDKLLSLEDEESQHDYIKKYASAWVDLNIKTPILLKVLVKLSENKTETCWDKHVKNKAITEKMTRLENIARSNTTFIRNIMSYAQLHRIKAIIKGHEGEITHAHEALANKHKTADEAYQSLSEPLKLVIKKISNIPSEFLNYEHAYSSPAYMLGKIFSSYSQKINEYSASLSAPFNIREFSDKTPDKNPTDDNLDDIQPLETPKESSFNYSQLIIAIRYHMKSVVGYQLQKAWNQAFREYKINHEKQKSTEKEDNEGILFVTKRDKKREQSLCAERYKEILKEPTDSTQATEPLPIHYACGYNNERPSLEMVKLILKRFGGHFSLSCVSKMPLEEDHNQPLHIASSKGLTDIVEYIIHNQPQMNVNTGNSQGNTPLHLAAQNGHTETVIALLKDSKTSDTNNDNKTPCDLAKLNNHQDIVRLLTPLDNLATAHLNYCREAYGLLTREASVETKNKLMSALTSIEDGPRDIANLAISIIETTRYYPKIIDFTRGSELAKTLAGIASIAKDYDIITKLIRLDVNIHFSPKRYTADSPEESILISAIKKGNTELAHIIINANPCYLFYGTDQAALDRSLFDIKIPKDIKKIVIKKIGVALKTIYNDTQNLSHLNSLIYGESKDQNNNYSIEDLINIAKSKIKTGNKKRNTESSSSSPTTPGRLGIYGSNNSKRFKQSHPEHTARPQ